MINIFLENINNLKPSDKAKEIEMDWSYTEHEKELTSIQAVNWTT